jgi:hypothetical protein
VPLPEVEKAYLAGIIDGEGCIGIGRRRGATKKGRALYISPTLQVSNTKQELLTWLADRYGGGVYFCRDKREKRKPHWVWIVAGQRALRAIRDARPYLLLKTEQADIVLSLPRYSTVERDKLGRIKKAMQPEDFAANENAVTKIAALNKRGI